MKLNDSHQNILITGATGFLGSHLLRGLLEAGYEVLAFRRKTSDLWRIKDVAPQIKWFDVDGDLAAPFKVTTKIHHVIHTATNYGRSGEQSATLVESNLLFPLKLYQLAAVYNTYTFFNTDTVLYEYLNGYALSKRQFADWLKLLSNSIRVFNIKLEHMYGRQDDSSKFVSYIIDQCLANVPALALTAGEQKRDFIHVADVVAAYLHLLQHYAEITTGYIDLELGMGSAVTIKHLVEQVAEITQTRTLLRFGVLPYRKNELMYSQANLGLFKQLGWQPEVTLQQGLADVIAERKAIK